MIAEYTKISEEKKNRIVRITECRRRSKESWSLNTSASLQESKQKENTFDEIK